MRAVQEKKGGRQGESEREEKKGMACHSYTEKKRDESHTAPSGMRVCCMVVSREGRGVV